MCVTRCCLFAPPSVSPDSPLPCFPKAVPVSSTNKRFSGYILFRAQPRGRRWVGNRTFGRSGGVQTRCRLSPAVSVYLHSAFCGIGLLRLPSLIQLLIHAEPVQASQTLVSCLLHIYGVIVGHKNQHSKQLKPLYPLTVMTWDLTPALRR